MASRCYLCLRETKYDDAFLCTDCFCTMQNYRWLSCSRCGNTKCVACDELAEFVFVTSLYQYRDILANLIIFSKEDNNLNVQQVFKELFFIPVKNALTDLISKNNYSHIIVSPLSKDRILSGSWHPNIFYEQVLNYIYSEENIDNNAQILFPYYSKKKKKQSLIPIDQRGKTKVHLDSSQLIYNDKEPLISHENKKILLLDDVLTTGQSALLCKNLSENYFPNFSWDLLTILRAPRGEV